MLARRILAAIALLAFFESCLAYTKKCYKCNSSENFDCQANTLNLDKTIYTCEARYCFRSNKTNGNAERGCYGTYPIDDDGLHIDNNDDREDYANHDSYNFTCVSCNSTNDPNCKSNASLVTGTCLFTSCYSSIDGTGKVVRGCGNCSSDSSTCDSCINAVKCNVGNYETCYKCKGTDCVEISSNTNVAQCHANNLCYTKITADGLVERGCPSEDLQCEGATCKKCNGDNCNGEVFPANRLSCLQCNGTDDCNNGTTIGKYCSKYDENDQCFSYADGIQMVRGCLSDDIQNNCTTDSNCEKCKSTNCNTLKLNELRPTTTKPTTNSTTTKPTTTIKPGPAPSSAVLIQLSSALLSPLLATIILMK